VTFGAPNGPTYAVGRSTSRPDGPVLFLDCPIMLGNSCDPCYGLCVTPNCSDGPRSCAGGPAMLRVDPPFSGDRDDGRPGYESIDIPEYG
jgi:hypothetical protein